MKTKYLPKFHGAEIAVQKRLGLEKLLANFSQEMILDEIPTGFKNFLIQLSWVILGVVDKDGYPWAIPIFGRQGFIRPLDKSTLSIDALPGLKGFFGLEFDPGKKIALLGIDLSTRRRIRINGSVTGLENEKFFVGIEQCYGNCPQYIQRRELRRREERDKKGLEKVIEYSGCMSLEVKNILETSDTFFIASRSKEFSSDFRTGMDVSHRGGKPGFVKVEDNDLYFPDFSGNRFFNTLGNIESDGRVGLFFPNFKTAESVFMSGKAEILWESENLKQFPGAERMVRVWVEQNVYIPDYLEMTGELIEYSPVLNSTGTWR